MSFNRRDILCLGGAFALTHGCSQTPFSSDIGATGPLEVFDPAVHELIDAQAQFTELGRGYTWAEGPTWDRARRALYFTDVPGNVAYKWSSASGVEIFLDPSGKGGEVAGFREPGANGLWYARDGSLLVCNHGERRLERINLETLERTSIADKFGGVPFNSPNDIVEASDGRLFFTDPPYGLEGLDASPMKEQTSNGVYCCFPDGTVRRLLSDMTFPNGVGLSPDESMLYVSQSDPNAAYVREINLHSDGTVAGDRILFDAMNYMADDAPGLPDGMAVSAHGAIFVTGPGGVFILDRSGKALGRLNTGRATANCAFGSDGSVLFITSQDRLLSIPTKTSGVQWLS